MTDKENIGLRFRQALKRQESNIATTEGNNEMISVELVKFQMKILRGINSISERKPRQQKDVVTCR